MFCKCVWYDSCLLILFNYFTQIAKKTSVWRSDLRTFNTNKMCGKIFVHLFIHSFIQAISIAHLQVRYYSKAFPTQHGYCAEVSRRSATGSCKLRTCPRSLRGG